MNLNAHDIIVTGIVVKDGKYLITQRSLDKKNFPGKWNVPGGNLELKDYIAREKDTGSHWYNILEGVLKREIREEVGLEVKNIGYITSMTFIKPDNTPALIISLFAEYDQGEVVLNEESIDYQWVGVDEAKNYELIEGIYEELIMLDNLLKGNKIEEWKKEFSKEVKGKTGVGFGVMILKNGKVLLGKRNDDPEKASSELRGEGTWTMPGGKLRFHETFEEGAKREVMEETGMKVNTVKVICVNNEMVDTAHFVTIGLFCENFEGEPKVMEPDEITRWEWFSFNDLPEKIYFPSKNVLENYKKEKFYIEK